MVFLFDISVDRDDRSFGRDRNRDSDKTDTDWRARPAADSFDDYPPRRGDDSFGDSKFIFIQLVSSVFWGCFVIRQIIENSLPSKNPRCLPIHHVLL